MRVHGAGGTVESEPDYRNIRLTLDGAYEQREDFEITVSTPDYRPGGVRYSLAAEEVAHAVLERCAGELEALVPGSGEWALDEQEARRAEAMVGTWCTADAPAAGERVFRVEIDEAVQARFVARASRDDVELALGLRHTCEVAWSERECVGFERGARTLDAWLEPGTYFLVVRARGPVAGARVMLDFEHVTRVCEPHATRCTGGQSMEICDDTGSQWHPIACSGACRAERQACFAITGDACYWPYEYFGRQNVFNVEFEWRRFANLYELDAASCSSSGVDAGLTRGPDHVTVVTLQPGEAVHARLESTGGPGALYLLERCRASAEGCTVAAEVTTLDGDAFVGTLRYRNASPLEETVYLVADSDGRATHGTLRVTRGHDLVACAATSCVWRDEPAAP